MMLGARCWAPNPQHVVVFGIGFFRARRHRDRWTGGIGQYPTFEPTDEPQVVWSAGDVKVSAVRSTHIAGHVSYRADTPAGSVVIGSDAGNDVLRHRSSTSDQVER